MFFDVFLPLLGVAAYVFVYRAIGAPEEYVGFVVIGGAMTAFWMNVLWSMSSQLYWEKEQGNLALYIMAPNTMMAVLLGMALGGLVATALRAIVIVVVGSWLFGVQYEVSNYLQLFVVFLLAMVALYGMGMMSASMFLLLSREAWHISNLAQEPIYLLSGFFFPIKNLSFWVALCLANSPHPGIGCHAPARLPFRRVTRVSHRQSRDRHPGSVKRGFPDWRSLSPCIYGEARHPGGRLTESRR